MYRHYDRFEDFIKEKEQLSKQNMEIKNEEVNIYAGNEQFEEGNRDDGNE